MKHFSNKNSLKVGNKWFKRGDEIPEKFAGRLGPLVTKGEVIQEEQKKEPIVFKDSVKVKTKKLSSRGKK